SDSSYNPAGPTSLKKSLLYFSSRWAHGALELHSITVKSMKSPLGTTELKNLAIAAWCEAFGIEVPSEDSLKEKLAAQKAGKSALRDEMLAELRGGAKGVEKWNARERNERQRAGRFRRVDLSGAKLRGAKFDHLDFQNANLANASLEKASFFGSALLEANFEGASLRGSSL